MGNKQLYEKQSNQYNPFFPIVRLDDIIETISDKSIQWILNNYNHIYVEYSESVAITRNKVPSLLRRNGLWISYNTGKDIVTEWYKGKNTDITAYNQWTDDANWAKFEPLTDGKVTYQHLSHALKQLMGKGNTITNFPDEEDITTDGTVLSFKDREYDTNNFSGLGRIILRKNIVLDDGVYKNILTQDMINKSNTSYEIRYDFDLNSAEITIPEGCVLDFQGGSLKNGTIILNKTKLGNSNLKIFKNILLQGASGSDIYLSMYEWDATYTENNFNILYNIYSVIRNTDFQVVWDIKDIFLIQNKGSIFLDNNKVHDFNNTIIHIHSEINACLFNIEGNYIQTSYTTISNAIQDNFFKNKYGVILVKDLTPLYKRPGYSDTYYREDVLLVENNRLLSSPILEYDNDAETKAEIYFIDADSKVAFKNLVFDRKGSQNIVSLLQISKCYNPIISNITVDSDNKNNLTGEMGIISITESYNPYLEDITISNTHGDAVGSGLYSYSILLLFVSNVVIKRLTAASAWHTFGCRGINGITVYDSNIDGFDNHVYSCNFKFENCNFHTYFIEDPEIGYTIFNNCVFNKYSPGTSSTGIPYSKKNHRIYENCTFIDLKEGLQVVSGYTKIDNPRSLLSKMDGKPSLSVYNCTIVLNNEYKVPTLFEIKSSLPDHYNELPGYISIDIDGLVIEDNVGSKFDLYIINEVFGKEITSNVTLSNIKAIHNGDWHISLNTTTIKNGQLKIFNITIPTKINNVYSPNNIIIENSIIGDIQIDPKFKVLNFKNCEIYFLAKEGNTIQQGFYDNCSFVIIGDAPEDFFLKHYTNANVTLKNCSFNDSKLLIRHKELRDLVTSEEEALIKTGVSHVVYNKYIYPEYLVKDLDYLYITEGISKLTLQEYETLLKYKLIYIGQILISNTGNYKYIINGNEISREEYYYHIHGIISAGNSRPILSENTYNIGFQYFDTNINKPIFWTGAKWVDATGAEV